MWSTWWTIRRAARVVHAVRRQARHLHGAHALSVRLNGDGTVGGADATQPDCATPPPRSAATTGNYDDAADFGCQLLSHSMVAGALPLPDPDMRAVQATDAAVAVVRHDFR
ncbi:MAG: hypothetical protein IPQ07_44865 [Myxococcales bacterium]|nr:hypothetical protein [Myxococcales bacterium]